VAQSLAPEIKEKLEEKIGEYMGLERAAQKAVEELTSKGLLEGVEDDIKGMSNEAGGHEEKLQNLIQSVGENYGLELQNIKQHAEETAQKATQIMQTYLGDKPEKLDALEFLCLAEGGEVTHYEVLSKLASSVKNKKFATLVQSILRQEKQHLQRCTKLAKQNTIDE
jgi:ferritin-like metal-binding protein YciE